MYFYNRATKQSKWTRPENATIVDKSNVNTGQGFIRAPRGTGENSTKVRAWRRVPYLPGR